MSESAEQQPRSNRLGSIGSGGALFLLGLPCWYFLGSALMRLAPFAEWPKALATVGMVVPLLFGMCWKYDTGRKKEIGYLVFGWLVTSFGLGGLFLFMLSLGPPH